MNAVIDWNLRKIKLVPERGRVASPAHKAFCWEREGIGAWIQKSARVMTSKRKKTSQPRRRLSEQHQAVMRATRGKLKTDKSVDYLSHLSSIQDRRGQQAGVSQHQFNAMVSKNLPADFRHSTLRLHPSVERDVGFPWRSIVMCQSDFHIRQHLKKRKFGEIIFLACISFPYS